MLLVLQSVFLRVRRYDDIRTRLGISPTALSSRLSEAVRVGVLERAAYQSSNRIRHEYRLTEHGLALWQLLISVWTWERDWAGDRDTSLPDLLHLDCGQPTAAPLGCRQCGQRVWLSAVRADRREPLLFSGTSRRFRRKDSRRLAVDPLLFFPVTMELLGDRWSVGLLAGGLLGARHFSEFERDLGIVPSVLSGRLARLVELDVMRTTAATTRTDARAYDLTAKGRAFFPTLAFIADWSFTRYPEVEPALLLMHRDHRLEPALLCDHCGTLLERSRVRVA